MLAGESYPRPGTDDLVLRAPTHWTAVVFCAALSFVHFSIALPAFWHGRFGGHMSLILGVVFAAVAVAAWRLRCETLVLADERRIWLRARLGPLKYCRSIDFAQVHGVRLSLSDQRAGDDSRIEILCENEDIECPPTRIPRQEALCLAMLLDVQLIKVSSDAAPEPAGAERVREAQADRVM